MKQVWKNSMHEGWNGLVERWMYRADDEIRIVLEYEVSVNAY